jgi:NhaP-type Na+/H+ or K+/H+ antiporter
VAAVAHALGLAWGPAWVLGAAVAPTDATAVGVLARALPRRILTVLRTESLVNDGAALVIYGLAVGITRGEEHFGALHVLGLFLLAYGGGAAVGVLTAWLAVQVRRHLNDPLLGNVAAILTRSPRSCSPRRSTPPGCSRSWCAGSSSARPGRG